jgi:folate-dependent phosphoribosylglycinamide formyltransferase PurN
VFGSGNGSNFEAIIKHFAGKKIEFTCISDKSNAYILERAKNLGIKNFYVPFY